MNPHPHLTRIRSSRQAMSLIELLVVISIIGVLAGLILPAVGNVKKKAKVVQAQKDMADLKGAISVYQNDYSRLPASSAAAGVGSDFTYGTTGTGYGTNIYNNNNVGYQAGNAELMVMLTAGTFPGYTPHASIQNNAKNPRRNPYFNAKSSAATSGPGLGTDGVMRDPWGSPYIIALDLNYDGWVSNSVYRLDALNAFNTGLSRVGPPGPPGVNTWALKDSAMIFSFGGDGMFDSATAAGTEPNKDNVLSWK